MATKKTKKATKVESEKRVNEVIELILIGLSRYEIIQYASEKWGLTERQVDEYRRKANKVLLARSKIRRDNLIARALARYTRWMKKAESEKDYRFAADMQDRVVRLFGLNAPEEHKIGLKTKQEYEFILKTNKEIRPELRRAILSRLGELEPNGETS